MLISTKKLENNSIFATGLTEIFNKFTNGYKPSEHISKLFNAICNCNGFNPIEINTLSEQLINNAKKFNKEDLNKALMQIKDQNKDNSYYSRINAIGIYKVVSELQFCKDMKTEDLNKIISNASELLGYQYQRVEKDISLYKTNIEKMRQALEIIELNISSK